MKKLKFLFSILDIAQNVCKEGYFMEAIARLHIDERSRISKFLNVNMQSVRLKGNLDVFTIRNSLLYSLLHSLLHSLL